MKIAYLVNQYPRVSHTFIRREIEGLEAHGVEVTRVAVRGAPEALVDEADRREAERTRVILESGAAHVLGSVAGCVAKRPVRFARALRLTIKIGLVSERGLLRNLAYLAEACVLRDWVADSEHLHAHFGINSTAVAMLCRVLGGPPYSFTVHGPEEFDKPLMISLRDKIERARFVVAITSFCRSQLYRHCDYDQWSKVHIVHCALDSAFLDAPPVELPTRPRLVTVGRLNEQKGQALIVQAAVELKRRGVDFELQIVGDGELRVEIERLIEEHDLGEQVRIMGWATNDEVRAYIEGARAFILPSFAEGLPVVIMEALARGRPVLTTYVAGIPELVEPGECGWLVPAGSVEALADAMEQVLRCDTAELERLGREGRRRVRAEHDAMTEAGKLKGLFERYKQ